MPHRRWTTPAVLIVSLATGLGLAAPTAAADRDSLPHADSGHRPGPDALYAPPPRAPQLENTGPWAAKPILVSGAELLPATASGSTRTSCTTTTAPPGSPTWTTRYGPRDHLFSPAGGTFAYPTDPVYAHNAADLVELRARPLPEATAFRVTLNTLQDPARTAFTIALGGRREPGLATRRRSLAPRHSCS